MVLIISRVNDSSTNNIIDWLRHFRIDYFRITPNRLLQSTSIIFTSPRDIDVQLDFKDKSLLFSEVDFIFYRNGRLGYHYLSSLDVLKEVNEPLRRELLREHNYFNNYLLEHLGKGPVLTSPKMAQTNKLVDLELALTSGFSIPKTIVTTKKSELASFAMEQDHGIIVKAMSERPLSLSHKNLHFIGYTKEMKQSIIEELPEYFFPTLCQEYVKAEYEIRVFYIDGTVYSTAVFNRTGDEYDHRNNSAAARTNIYVPYRLSSEIEKRINDFMQSKELITGSIDLLCSEEGIYYFLEVNPVGQYIGSYRCNYNLECVIASYIKSQVHG